MLDVQATEGAAQSAIQYFENMRNFLVAVGKMKLLTFGASDLETVRASLSLSLCVSRDRGVKLGSLEQRLKLDGL